MRLKDKVAVVTGGGNGIGRAIAVLFAAEGAAVTVADIEAGPGRDVAAQIAADGGRSLAHTTDTSDADSAKAAVAATLDAFGQVDILVNNAAAFVFGSVEEITQADWNRVFGVNVIGYANMVRECLPALRTTGHGAVVNIASVSSFIAQPGFIPYNVSKGAVMQLTRCLAMDLAPDNIRVNAVCPGEIRTRATDQHIANRGLDPEKAYEDFGKGALMKRMGRPEEIAAVALFLASPDASFMTGAHVVVDGGATLD
ncbi:MAG: SDR family NAD(P)-dependent oxidoreductase [Alphaproteobacteria bacterium]